MCDTMFLEKLSIWILIEYRTNSVQYLTNGETLK